MIALPALPGCPEFTDMESIIQRALSDLETLEHGGVDAVCVENDYDRPHQLIVSPEVAASFTRIAHEISQHAKVPVGLQVLLNDWRASLSIAKVINARFVRLDFFVDRVRIQAGVIEPEPEAVIAFRKQIGAETIALFTDVQVKYSELLEPGKRLRSSVHQAIAQGSDAIVVSGKFTGDGPALDDVREAREAAAEFPVLIGSGTTVQNVRELFRHADGAIVGTAFKRSTASEELVVPERVKEFMDVVRTIRITSPGHQASD